MDGTTLAQRREALGISHQQLADEVGISRVTIWRIEKTGQQPTPLMARSIDAALSRLEAQASALIERVG